MRGSVVRIGNSSQNQSGGRDEIDGASWRVESAAGLQLFCANEETRRDRLVPSRGARTNARIARGALRAQRRAAAFARCRDGLPAGPCQRLRPQPQRKQWCELHRGPQRLAMDESPVPRRHFLGGVLRRRRLENAPAGLPRRRRAARARDGLEASARGNHQADWHCRVS